VYYFDKVGERDYMIEKLFSEIERQVNIQLNVILKNILNISDIELESKDTSSLLQLFIDNYQQICDYMKWDSRNRGPLNKIFSIRAIRNKYYHFNINSFDNNLKEETLEVLVLITFFLLFNNILNTDNDYRIFVNELKTLYIELIKKQIEGDIIPLIESTNFTIKRDISKQNDIQKQLKEKIENEIKRVQKKVPGWFEKTDQINSKILYAFIEIYLKKGNVTVEELEIKSNVPTFKSNYDQMKFIAPHNNAKVFEEIDGNVYFWKEVEEFIWNYYNKYIK
jgi:hypothetical protein